MGTHMKQENSAFHQLAPGVGTGNPSTKSWQRISECPLVILVGVTGVGKSTTLHQLATALAFYLLPNRRTLTDKLIIASLQQQAGQPVEPVTDRAERFAYTRRFRAQFPGGMGYALSQLWIEPEQLRAPWVFFDGLRGANEVESAAAELPQARFIVLHAPDVVRVQRLLGRDDQFDQVQTNAVSANPTTTGEIRDFADIGMPEADALFAQRETKALLALCAPPVGQGTVAVDDLRAKLTIVMEERRNYDPIGTTSILQARAPERTLVVDTNVVRAPQAATQIVDWLSHSK